MDLYVVAVYEVHRVYGGPEEGGWWYTEGVLDGIIDATASEQGAYDVAYGYNRPDGEQRRDGTEAHVVQLGRRELRPEVAAQVCHADWETTEEDYVLRWDVPTVFPEGRPHYC